jgi:hypothetical protein
MAMELTFQRGDPQNPKGHALVYFRVSTEPDKVYATYIIALPIKSDLSKYVPPFLSSHLGGMPLNEFSAFAMPPVPEPVSGFEGLEKLAQIRDDDLISGSDMFSFDLQRMMEAVSELVQAYTELCGDRIWISEEPRYPETPGIPHSPGRDPAPEPALDARPGGDDISDDTSYEVNEVIFGLMSESDKLAELSNLMGKLRFAVEGQDAETAGEAAAEITTLARHLPENFQVERLLTVAKDTSARSSKLAQLYLDRCFRLSAGDYTSVQTLESEIQTLNSPET